MVRLAMNDLTPSERRLVSAVIEGEWLDLTDEDDRTIRPELVRQLLIGHFRWPEDVRPDPRGVRIRSAEFTSQFDLTDLTSTLPLLLIDCLSSEPLLMTRAHLAVVDLSGMTAPAVLADWVRIDYHLSIERAQLHTDQLPQALALSEANIGGRLSLTGTRLSNTVGPALQAEYLRTGGSAYLRRLVATGHGTPGAVRLRGANIGGALEFGGAQLTNSNGPALSAYDLKTGTSAYLHREFRAEGTGPIGAVNLQSANIGGTLELDSAHLVNNSGPALLASDIRTTRSVVARRGARFTSNSELGVINLRNSQIGERIDLGDSRVINADGPAILAQGTQTAGSVLLHDGFQATGVIHLHGARIGGQLTLGAGWAKATGPGTLALVLRDTQVTNDLLLPAADRGDGLIDVDGLTYRGVPAQASLTDWLRLLAHDTQEFKSQPYLQLAAAHQAAGHERDVRRIRIAQQKDLIRRGRLDARGRVWHRITGATLGYGYRPAIALLWLTLVLTTSVILITGIAGPNRLTTRQQGGSCSTVEQIGLALNAATPLVKPDTLGRCQLLATTSLGQAIIVCTWVLQALTWAFATLFVAGFTGVVRKTT